MISVKSRNYGTVTFVTGYFNTLALKGLSVITFEKDHMDTKNCS